MKQWDRSVIAVPTLQLFTPVGADELAAVGATGNVVGSNAAPTRAVRQTRISRRCRRGARQAPIGLGRQAPKPRMTTS